MLINLSNHPYAEWDSQQKEAALIFGECIDIRFPQIPPEADEKEILKIADYYYNLIFQIVKDQNSTPLPQITVHLMGEQTFCFILISRLLSVGIPCIASCSRRDVELLDDGTKLVHFHFTRFRYYS